MNKSEFLRLIEEINASLIRDNVSIPLRPMSAISKFYVNHKIYAPVVPDGPPIPGDYNGDSLSAHINEWYQKKYGDRLKINFSPGSAALLIRGDAWRIDFPLLYGKFRMAFDRDLQKPGNALRLIKGLTPEYAKSLSPNDLQEIARFFCLAFDAIQRLCEIARDPLIETARSDLISAVNNIFIQHPNYGQSKWASLQFSEKLLKCFIKKSGGNYPKRGHNLKLLAKLAVDKGLQILPTSIINKIQCSARVRYGEEEVSLNDAIEAHHASLVICSVLAPAIKLANPKPNKAKGLDQTYDESVREGLFYSLPQLGFYYYCEKIEGNLIHWVLIESWQHGQLIQAKFSQLKKNAKDYIEVREKKTLERLKKMLNDFKELDRGPRNGPINRIESR